MAKIVIKEAVIMVNAVNLSDHVSSVTVETSFDSVDVTAMGAKYRENLTGLGDASITLELFQDYAAASVDATLWPLSQSPATFPVTVKATEAIVSPTNPLYTLAAAVLLNYNPLDGSVGDASSTSVTFQNAGQLGLVRTTA